MKVSEVIFLVLSGRCKNEAMTCFVFEGKNILLTILLFYIWDKYLTYLEQDHAFV